MILYGASGHAKVIMDILASQKLPVRKIFDANPAIEDLYGCPVVHREEELDFRNELSIIAIGNNRTRKRVALNYSGEFSPAVAHRSASVSKEARVGEGTVVMAQASVNSGAHIGKHCIINTGAVVEHDVELENFVHVSPKAALAGSVKVGEGTHVGIGATVIQGVHIGKWAIIGAGTVIIEDVPDYATVVGVPGKIIKMSNEVKEIS